MFHFNTYEIHNHRKVQDVKVRSSFPQREFVSIIIHNYNQFCIICNTEILNSIWHPLSIPMSASAKVYLISQLEFNWKL